MYKIIAFFTQTVYNLSYGDSHGKKKNTCTVTRKLKQPGLGVCIHTMCMSINTQVSVLYIAQLDYS